MWNGLIQSKLGVAGPPLASATTANSARITTSAVSSHFCVAALSSIPMTQIHVISTIHRQPTIVTAHAVFAAESQPKSLNV